MWLSSYIPCPPGGAYASSRTLAREAMDAMASHDEGCRARTAKSCGPDPPTLGSTLRAQEPGGRWLSSPDTGEITYKPQNHCAGKAGSLRLNLWFSSCARYPCYLCTRGRGCSRHPVFPAPSVFRREKRQSNPGAIRRGRRSRVSARTGTARSARREVEHLRNASVKMVAAVQRLWRGSNIL